MLKHKIYTINHLKSVLSTNDYLKDLKKESPLPNDTVILADYQERGKGQKDNHWHSSSGKNLLTSIYLQPEIDVSDHFFITIITSLAISRALYKLNKLTVSIKWPNDIYVADSKLAGILIENSIMGNSIRDTIIGIGLNLNENSFPEHLPNPISLYQLTEKKLHPQQVLKAILDELPRVFKEFKTKKNELFEEYKSRLYRLNKKASFVVGTEKVEGTIRDVKSTGELIIEIEDGKHQSFLFGEISYLI